MKPNGHCKHFHYSWVASYSVPPLPAAAEAEAAVAVASGAASSAVAEIAIVLAAEN